MKCRLCMIMFLFLAGCSQANVQTPTGIFTPVITTSFPSTNTPLASDTLLTNQASPTQTESLIPVPTDTPIPKPTTIINDENVEYIQLLVQKQDGSYDSADQVPYSQVAFSPDGHMIAVATRTGVYLQDANTLGELSFIPTERRSMSVAISPDGQTVAAGPTLQLWRVLDSSLLLRLDKNIISSTSSYVVDFSPDGKMLASGEDVESGLGRVDLWDVKDGSLVRTLDEFGYARDFIESLTFAPDGQILAAGTSDGLVRLWKVSTGEHIRILDPGVNYNSVTGINTVEAFSPDGKILASATNTDISIWQVSNGYLLHTLKGHSDLLSSLAFSPDGQLLVSGSWDNTIRFWKVSDGSFLYSLKVPNVTSVAFSPDGRTLAFDDFNGLVQLFGVLH